jgi:hypothetical protein
MLSLGVIAIGSFIVSGSLIGGCKLIDVMMTLVSSLKDSPLVFLASQSLPPSIATKQVTPMLRANSVLVRYIARE